MITISEFFNNIDTKASWPAGVTFNRTNALPLDKYSVFKGYDAAKNYIDTNPIAYLGQIITVIDEIIDDSDAVTGISATVYVVNCHEFTTTTNELGETEITPSNYELIELATTENATDDVETTLNKLVEDIANHEKRIVTLENSIEGIIRDIGLRVGEDGGPSGIYELIANLELGDKIDVKQDTLGNESAISIEESDGVKYLNVKVDGSSIIITKEGKLQANLDSQIIENLTDYTVSIDDTGEPDEGYSKTYTFTQLGKNIGKINIPKDMVVSSGIVETYTEDTLPEGVTSAGTYIVLTLANANGDVIYIPASALLDDKAITGGATTDITIDVDENNNITATLTTAIQEKLNKIDTLEQSINSLGIAANKDYSTTVQADDENLITSGGVATYVSNYVTENVVVPTHGELNEDATDDTYASSQDVYEALSVYRV